MNRNRRRSGRSSSPASRSEPDAFIRRSLDCSLAEPLHRLASRPLKSNPILSLPSRIQRIYSTHTTLPSHPSDQSVRSLLPSHSNSHLIRLGTHRCGAPACGPLCRHHHRHLLIRHILWSPVVVRTLVIPHPHCLNRSPNDFHLCVLYSIR